VCVIAMDVSIKANEPQTYIRKERNKTCCIAITKLVNTRMNLLSAYRTM